MLHFHQFLACFTVRVLEHPKLLQVTGGLIIQNNILNFIISAIIAIITIIINCRILIENINWDNKPNGHLQKFSAGASMTSFAASATLPFAWPRLAHAGADEMYYAYGVSCFFCLISWEKGCATEPAWHHSRYLGLASRILYDIESKMIYNTFYTVILKVERYMRYSLCADCLGVCRSSTRRARISLRRGGQLCVLQCISMCIN
jgi:hypothetical protein